MSTRTTDRRPTAALHEGVYTVTDRTDLHFDGAVYRPGESVKLPDEDAKPLLADGIVAPQGARQNNPPQGARQNDPPQGARQNNPPQGARQNDPPQGARQNNPPQGARQNDPPQGARQKDAPVPQGAKRKAAIRAAIKGLDKTIASNWTKDGKADVRTLEAALDFDITAAERDEAEAAIAAESG